MTLKLSLTEEEMKGRADNIKHNNSNYDHLLCSSYVAGTAQKALHTLTHFTLSNFETRIITVIL